MGLVRMIEVDIEMTFLKKELSPVRTAEAAAMNHGFRPVSGGQHEPGPIDS